jgi:asparagine synthase (glutamine-hydrolysing)
MCGIAGIIGLNNQSQATELIKRMSQSLAHRGPDAEGFYIDQNAAFTHRRLSIIDISDSANQPIFDETKRFLIILNGEIYNYLEVKQKLSDYPFKTFGDTEVILAAYLKYGAECLSLLNGMFAFAIWDKIKQELFIARDRLGVKPLYYAINQEGHLIFASEIRAILSSELVSRKLNTSALYNYLLFQSVYSPDTIVDGIFQLPAGEFATFHKSELTRQKYWQIDKNFSVLEEKDEEAIQKNVKDLLLKSIESRMISDVSLGAFLSGGIDSSAIVALMSEVSDRPIQTFSVNFAESRYDESDFSNVIAKKFKTDHTFVNLTAKDLLEELPNALKATDSPSGDGLNTYIVSKATKKAGITVALSGLGGDEIFAGYPNFLNWLKTQNRVIQTIPTFIKKSLGNALSISNQSRLQRLGELLANDKINLSQFYALSRQVFSQQLAHKIFRNGHYGTQIQNILENKQHSISKFPNLSQFSIAEMLGYTQNVLLKDTDQFSMASALEVREPFFDYHLVEYVLRIPDKFKYPKYPKSLLVEAISPLLPNKIVYRKKMGFVFPWEKWMRNELREFCQNRIEKLIERGIFNPAEISKMWKDFINHKNGVLWSHLWHLVVLTEWLENNKF